MNPVLILTRNCLEFTKKCIESVRRQDIPTDILVIDNDSTDSTRAWLYDERIPYVDFTPQIGVSAGWNFGLKKFFQAVSPKVFEHVLVVNNDTILPRWFYHALLDSEVPFVTGASTENMADLAELPGRGMFPSPDFSAFLIRREAWEKIGPFDESMKNYASDNDWHVRAHRVGITLWNSGVPFYHERSSTLRNATHKDRREIELQADADREVFRSIYGCYPWEPGYAELFKASASPETLG